MTGLPIGFAEEVGGSKLEWFTVLEYLALLAEKASSYYISSKFVLFCLVGASGVVVHLGVMRVLLVLAGAGFVGA